MNTGCAEGNFMCSCALPSGSLMPRCYYVHCDATPDTLPVRNVSQWSPNSLFVNSYYR